MKHELRFCIPVIALLAFPGAASAAKAQVDAVKVTGTQAPMFEVDPMWPKPFAYSSTSSRADPVIHMPTNGLRKHQPPVPRTAARAGGCSESSEHC